MCGVVVAWVLATAAWALAAEGSSVLFRVTDDRIVEASGVAVDVDGSALFVIQDAGTDSTDVFALGPTGGILVALSVPGVPNEDWEDIDLGRDDEGEPALFIGDIGDANAVRRSAGEGARREFAVVRVGRPDVEIGAAPRTAEATDVRRWRFAYEDGDSHNAESLLVQPGTGRIFVVDKVEEDGAQAYLWAAPVDLSADAVNVFRPVAALPVVGASGGSFSSDGTRLVVRDAEAAHIWEVVDGDVTGALARAPTVVPLPPQRQGEGVDFTPDGADLVVNGEGRDQPVYLVPVPAARDVLAASAPATASLVESRRPPPWIAAAAAGWLAAIALGVLVWRRSSARRPAR